MSPVDIAKLLNDTFGGKVQDAKPEAVCPHAYVDPASVLEICRFLRNDERLLMDHLELLGGADYKDRIEVVYVLTSLHFNHRFTLKCRLPRDNPKIHTVEEIWGVANWHEREAYDMYGIVFEGHSDFRRILCPEDWEGYPLRKDYKSPTRYRDMPV